MKHFVANGFKIKCCGVCIIEGWVFWILNGSKQGADGYANKEGIEFFKLGLRVVYFIIEGMIV